MASNPVCGHASRGSLASVLAVTVVVALCGMPGAWLDSGFFATLVLVLAVTFGLAVGLVMKLIQLATRTAESNRWSIGFYVVVGALVGLAILGALWLRHS